jgi:hypothetical protein
MTTIIGSKPVNVRYTNGHQEDIEIRAVPVRLMPRLSTAFLTHDEGTLIELYTGKKPEWSDSLTPESVEAVLATGEEMNRDPFAAYAARTLARSRLLASLSGTKETTEPAKA